MDGSRIWNYWALRYEKLWVQKYSLGPTRRLILQKLEDIITEKDKKYNILDMGCGIGQLIEEINQKFIDFDIDITGVDISKAMIDRAREKGVKAKLVVSSLEDFEDKGQSFDLIICSHSFPYYDDKKKAIEKFSNLLRSGGQLLLAQASENNIYDKLALFFVKLTTSKASYPSKNKVLSMVRPSFKEIENFLIKENFYMPSIYLFICKKVEETSHENITSEAAAP